MPTPVSRGDNRTATRRRIHPVVRAVLVLAIGLVPCFQLHFFPSILDLATWTGALLAAAAVVLGTRLGNGPEDLALRGRQFAIRLLAASLPVLVLLFAFCVISFQYGEPPRTAWVPIGFDRQPDCRCTGSDDISCLEELSLNDGAIRSCWGGISVTSVRLGLVLSYWGTASACGSWIGLLQRRRRIDPLTPKLIRTPTPSAAKAFPYRVFLSYAHIDRDFVVELARRLKRAGFQVWLDEEQMPSGEPIQKRLVRALEEAQHAVFVVTDAWLDGAWTKWELESFFQDRGKGRRLIPVLRIPRDVKRIGPYLHDLTTVDWSPDDPEPEARLWELRCGLRGEAPGPREEWARKGREAVDGCGTGVDGEGLQEEDGSVPEAR